MPSQSLYDHPAVPMRMDERGSKAPLPAFGLRSESGGPMPKRPAPAESVAQDGMTKGTLSLIAET